MGSGVFAGRGSGRSILYSDDNGQTTELEFWDQTRADVRLNAFRPSQRIWQAREKDSRPLFSGAPFLSNPSTLHSPRRQPYRHPLP